MTIIFITAEYHFSIFHEFTLILSHFILQQAAVFGPIDILCNQYFDNSLKEGTRKGRGTGTKEIFYDSSKFSTQVSRRLFEAQQQ